MMQSLPNLGLHFTDGVFTSVAVAYYKFVNYLLGKESINLLYKNIPLEPGADVD